MNTVKTHYPDFDVMHVADEWDSHTKEVVKKRCGPFPAYRFLTEREAEYLTIISQHIVYDNRREVISWIVHYLDEKLVDKIGESQRKLNVPPEDVLIREGLKAIDIVSKVSFTKEFADLDTQEQFQILSSLQQGKAQQIPEWGKIPQKELFNKLAVEITSAYYSHPIIWSEIGYGGPVYPKSYVRIEFGLTDPWEAKRNGE